VREGEHNTEHGTAYEERNDVRLLRTDAAVRKLALQ
jgi:hypothetical protein